MATRIVGLDIGNCNVRAIVLEAGFRTFEVIEAFEERVHDVEEELDSSTNTPPPHPSESPEETAAADELEAEDQVDEQPLGLLTPGQLDALDRIVARGILQADHVYTNFPEALVYFTELQLPFTEQREIEAVLVPQLDGRLPVDIEDLLVDYISLGETDEGQNRIFAGGARRTDVAEYLGLLRVHELEPRVFDVSPFYLWTGARFLVGSHAEPVVYVDFGAENTRLVVMRGDTVEVSRTIHDGGELITRRIAEEFSLPMEEARKAKHEHVSLLAEEESSDNDATLAGQVARDAFRPIIKEIRRTLQSYVIRHDDTVPRVYIGGGGAEMRGLPRWLEQNLDVEVSKVPVSLPMFARLGSFDEHGGRFVGALGLALRGTSTEPASSFNLRKGEFAFRGSYAFITERTTSLAWLAGLLVASLVIYFVGQTTLLKREFKAVESALATVTQQTFGAPVRDPEMVISRMQRGISDSSVVPAFSAFDIMIQVGQAVVATQDAQFVAETTSIEIDMQRGTARIGGNCESAQAADQLATNLEEAECLREVTRTSLSENRGGDGFEFAFSAQVQCQRVVAEAEGGP